MATVENGRRVVSSSPANQAPKRNWLGEVSTTAKPRPTAGILYGVPGIGKTSMAASIPGAVFLTDVQEDGISTLKASGLVPNVAQFPAVESWQDTIDALHALREGEHNHRALVVDTIGGLERYCHEAVCARDFLGDWGERGFAGWQRGYEVSLADWRLLLNLFDRLRIERNMSIFLLGHAKIRPFKNPEGPDYDRYEVDMHAKTWALTHKWCDVVLFANYETVFAKGDATEKKAKARGIARRVLYTERSAAFDAKNRHNLPPEIDMGDNGADAWKNFVTALKSGKEQANVA